MTNDDNNDGDYYSNDDVYTQGKTNSNITIIIFIQLF